jgi:hypothetical protein
MHLHANNGSFKCFCEETWKLIVGTGAMTGNVLLRWVELK